MFFFHHVVAIETFAPRLCICIASHVYGIVCWRKHYARKLRKQTVNHAWTSVAYPSQSLLPHPWVGSNHAILFILLFHYIGWLCFKIRFFSFYIDCTYKSFVTYIFDLIVFHVIYLLYMENILDTEIYACLDTGSTLITLDELDANSALCHLPNNLSVL